MNKLHPNISLILENIFFGITLISTSNPVYDALYICFSTCTNQYIMKKNKAIVVRILIIYLHCTYMNEFVNLL